MEPQQNEQESANQATTTQTETTAPDQQVAVQKNTLMAVLAYLGILIVIPFLVAKDDPFVKFHIKQGATIVIIELIIWTLGMSVMHSLYPFINLINLAAVVLSIIGIVNVLQGTEKQLPLIGHLGERFNI